MLLPHNEEGYHRVVSALNMFSDILFVHGTGLGKSYVFLELAKNIFQGKKILFIVPKHAVKEGISNYHDYDTEDAELTYKTYNYFSTESKAIRALSEYDVFVFDEAHHLGSSLYGANARKLIDGARKVPNKKVLGLTATNLRHDKTDVSEYFSTTVYGMSIFDGIQCGLVPSFEYLVCHDDFEQRKGLRNGNFIKKVDYFTSVPLLSETIARNPKQRWICFFSSISALEKYAPIIRKIFPEDYKILKITTQHSTRVNEISEYEKTVTLSVDKLLEGVHVPHTQGIILFRNVQSLPVFQQILGRIVHVGDSEHPLVIDCTETALKLFAKLLKRNEVNKGDGGSSINNQTVSTILYCSLQNTEHFNLTKLLALTQTEEVPKNYWTDDETELLRQNYLSPWPELLKLFPGRTKLSLQHKITAMRLIRPQGHQWTEKEENVVKQWYPISANEACKRLPNISRGAIYLKAKTLGLVQNAPVAWTDKEIELLKSNTALGKTYKELEQLLPGRSIDSIKGMCKKLGLEVNRIRQDGGKKWSDEELKLLAEIQTKSPDLPWDKVAEFFPGRSPISISRKAAQLGFSHMRYIESRRWSDDENDYLKNNLNVIPLDEICVHLQRKRPAILEHARKIGLKYIQSSHWNDERDEFLRNNYGVSPSGEIAKQFGLTRKDINRRARALHISYSTTE